MAQRLREYITISNSQSAAWDAPDNRVAGADYGGFDGTIELAVWRQSYRYRWRNGQRLDAGDRCMIKER